MIIPEYFPSARIGETAEAFVFEALKKVSGEFDIFYHKKIAHYQKLPCEIDFVVFDRNKSALVIEVKGGRISYRDKAWYSYEDKMKKDPVTQVMNATGRFIEHYGLKNRLLVDALVCFPDCDLDTYTDDLQEYQLLTRTHFQDLALALHRAFKSSRDSLGAALPHIPPVIDTREYNRIIKEVEGAVRYYIPLSRKIGFEDKKIRELSEEQYTIYECCVENRRILVNGVAGSGKTLLAQKIARQYYESGANTLLLCYNVMLGELFEKEGRRTTSGDKRKNSFTADACHHFLETLITDKSFYEKTKTLRREEREEFYVLDVPARVDEEIRNGLIPEGLYDVLIIDETQDFTDTLLEQIFRLVRQEGKIILLRDEKQVLFRQNFIPEPESFFRLRLHRNLRNTKAIMEFINRELGLQLVIHPDAPKGEEVDHIRRRDNKTLLQALTLQIDLLKKQELSTRDMLILYPEVISEEHCLHGVTSISGYPLKELPDSLVREKNTLYYTRIRKFKGLETDVLLVPNYELFKGGAFDTNYLYTALTRAKNRLFVFEKEHS